MIKLLSLLTRVVWIPGVILLIFYNCNSYSHEDTDSRTVSYPHEDTVSRTVSYPHEDTVSRTISYPHDVGQWEQRLSSHCPTVSVFVFFFSVLRVGNWVSYSQWLHVGYWVSIFVRVVSGQLCTDRVGFMFYWDHWFYLACRLGTRVLIRDARVLIPRTRVIIYSTRILIRGTLL